MTDTEKAELNREISTLLEPTPGPLRYATMTSEGGAWEYSIHEGSVDGCRPRDWCGSEDASGWLLDRMPEPRLTVLFDPDGRKSWECDPDLDNLRMHLHEDPYRKPAIALAAREWLRMKQ